MRVLQDDDLECADGLDTRGLASEGLQIWAVTMTNALLGLVEGKIVLCSGEILVVMGQHSSRLGRPFIHRVECSVSERRRADGVLVADLPAAQWGELDLLRKPVGGREITVALDTDTTHNEHRIVRRSNLCHSLRHGSFPALTAHEVIASLGSRGACADVGKISAVRRISELHAVVPASHVRHVQDLRLFGEVEQAADVEHVVGPCC